MDEDDDDQRKERRRGQRSERLQHVPRARREAVGALEVRAPARGTALLARLGLRAAVRTRPMRRLGGASEDLPHVLPRAGTSRVPEILVRHRIQSLGPCDGAQMRFGQIIDRDGRLPA
jgi:hypothetical protein